MKLVVLLGIAMFFASMPGCASHRQSDGRHVATWNGHSVVYDNIGLGDDVIVLVHGWASSRTFWAEQMKGLDDGGTRLIAIDLVGHGDSDAPEMPYRMDAFADCIAAVMDDAGVDNAMLVGHSMGCAVVRQFYRRYPQRTEALVLVDGGLQSFGTKEQQEQMAAPLYEPTYKAYMGRMFDGMAARMSPEWRDHVRAKAIETPQHVIIGGFEAMADDSIWKDDPINVPTLVIKAKAPFWTEEYLAYERSLIPDMEFHMWDGVSHFLMIDKPEEFNAEVRKFAKRVNDEA